MLHRNRDDEFKFANSQPVRNIQNASHVFVFFPDLQLVHIEL